MNALMFSPSYDLAGGAVIAANRLFHSLKQKGVHTKMLVGKSSFENEEVQVLPHNFTGEKILSRLTMPFGFNYVHYYGTFNLSNHPFFREADVVNYHTIHSGYFNYLALPKLTREKPSVFTLHDAWAFTGHCGVSFNCDRWKIGCGKCPNLTQYPPVSLDNTKWEWKIKKRTFSKSKLTLVTPSRWLASLVPQSLLADHKVQVIPYGLDTEVFKPLDKDFCRKVLGIPGNKKVLLFGAMGLTDWGKGGDLLVKALKLMPESLKKSIILLSLGQADEAFKKKFEIPMINLGYVSGDRMKSIAFNAADIFVFPTRSDNHPCIVQESMACGLPVVSFNHTGVPELVREGETGYLAEAENETSFAARIIQLLQEDDIREKMSLRSREIALLEYNFGLQAERYKELFTNIQSI